MRILLLILTFHALSAHAAQFKLGSLAGWKVNPVAKDSSRFRFFSGAEAVITFEARKDGAGPSVMVHKLAGVPVPRSQEEWRTAVLLGKNLRPIQERVIQRVGRAPRYFAEFEQQIAQDVTTKTVVMATEVKGEVYLLSYQSHLPIYQTEVRDVLKLLNGIEISP